MRSLARLNDGARIASLCITPFFINLVHFCEQEIRIDDFEADVVLDIPHNNAFTLLFFANHGLALGILHQLCNRLR